MPGPNVDDDSDVADRATTAGPQDHAEFPDSPEVDDTGPIAGVADGTPEPARPTHPPVAPVVTSAAQDDWYSGVCPYLQSGDGSYRPSQPDPSHRCAAQDPPGIPPPAFQERFCLTERHERCEMYKVAQETAGVIPLSGMTGTVSAPRRASLGLGTARSSGGSRRPALVVVAAIGGIFILILAVVLLLGSCSGDGGAAPGETPSAAPQSSEQPSVAPARTPRTTPGPTADTGPARTSDPAAETNAPSGETIDILYEIQDGEGLVKVAETFGTSRRRILRLNPGLEEIAPPDLPGVVIIVPVPAELSLEDLEALPGYQGLAP